MMVERPDERQWQELVQVYGTPEFHVRAWGVPETVQNLDAATCCGEVILLIFNLASSCIFVRRTDTLDWFFPMGTVRTGEGIVDEARREAMEEIGVVIEPIGVPLCEIVTGSSSNPTFQRWHFVVVAEMATSILEIRENAKIKDARLFDLPPPVNDVAAMSWLNDLHGVGTRFMRSMDAMDGI